MRKNSSHDRLAAILRAAREKAGLSQRELAAKLGTNQTAVSLIESGDQQVRVVELLDWCQVLGIDPHAVLDQIQGST